MANEVKTTKYQLVELQIPATAAAGQRVYFQDQAQLRSQVGQNIYIQSIETFGTNAGALSWLSNNPLAGAVELQNAMLVLNIDGREDINGIPLAVLNRVIPDAAAYIPSVYDLFLFNDLLKVDWTKSYIQLTAGTGAAYAYLFGVRYRNNLSDGNGNRL